MSLGLSAPEITREQPGPAGRPRYLLPVTTAVLSTLFFFLVHGHLIDDTYITLSYARNLAFHGTWGLLSDSVSNTATSPLNVLSLAALTFILRDAVSAAGVLYVGCQMLLVLALRRAGRSTGLPGWFPMLTIAALTVNPLLVSSIGLEVELGATALAWLLVFSIERRPFAFGLVAGAVALIRVDLLIFVAIIFLARKHFWLDARRSFQGAALVALPWFGFSWIVLGAAVPDTVIIKTLQGALRFWGEWQFGNGYRMYWGGMPLQTVLSFLPLGLAVLAGLWWVVLALRGNETSRRLLPFAVLAIAGAAYTLAYVQLKVPPYHWYYGPGIIAATVFGCAVVAGFAHRVQRIAGAVVIVALVGASVIAYAGAGLPRAFAPLTTNYTTSAQYAEIGREVGRLADGRTVASAGEIGVLAYNCDCTIIDVFSDRGRMPQAIADLEAHTGHLSRGLLRVNFAFFDYGLQPRKPELALIRKSGPPPPGYLGRWVISAPLYETTQLYLVPAE
ncbi:hypothetical protein [Amycolatopsis jejuensis]|uniref:hypothetical protein n=1 Tax=Amycolatopsis jejuensis TaxID=330084 RepID=UPI0005278121|nr:hypothetical protein [Amycolatopsis jejuensis]